MKIFDRKLWRNFDYILMLIIVLLVLFGSIFILNSETDTFTGNETSFMEIWSRLDFTYVRLHLTWFGIGIFLMLIVSVIDYHALSELSKYLYIFIILLLVYVLVTDKKINGTAGWITFGSSSDRAVQPAEFAKLVIILICAKFAAQSSEISSSPSFTTVMTILGVAGVPILLIFLQPDNGTAFVCILIVLAMLFMSGLDYKYLIIGGVLIVGAIVVLFLLDKLPSFIKMRFYDFFGLEFFGLEEYPEDVKHLISNNLTTAFNSIKAGGWSGLGLFSPTSNAKMGYLFGHSTDFVFASGVEAVGFVGGLAIIILYLCMMFRMLYLSHKAKDKLGSFIIIGVVAFEFAHIFENIGMNIGLMPVTGIPLPFISYGGSHMWANMLAIGMVQSVAMRRSSRRYDK